MQGFMAARQIKPTLEVMMHALHGALTAGRAQQSWADHMDTTPQNIHAVPGLLGLNEIRSHLWLDKLVGSLQGSVLRQCTFCRHLHKGHRLVLSLILLQVLRIPQRSSLGTSVTSVHVRTCTLPQARHVAAGMRQV